MPKDPALVTADMTTDPSTGLPAFLPCPTCRRPVSLTAALKPATFPFCSSRCRTTDLGAWASQGHVIPGTPLRLDGYDDDLDQLQGQVNEP